MAIPSIPNNMIVQQGNQQAYISWDNSAGALSYSIQRSTDNVTFSVLASPAGNSYTDTTAVLGTQYYYNVASVNASGTSPYCQSQGIVVAPLGEMSLGELRLKAQQRADRVNSNFVTTAEWNGYINQSLTELYDILITSFEDYFLAPPIRFTADGTTFLFSLPNGSNTFSNYQNQTITPAPFYKLKGVDLALNSSNSAFTTVAKFNFIDRNRYFYPTSGGTLYGAFNLQYRLMGTQIEFIPTPTASQIIQLWYIPRLAALLKDTDITTIGYSGWLEYVITDAAIKALQKEESDVSVLAMQKKDLLVRIQNASQNRDDGRPDTISDVRSNFNNGSGNPYGSNGPIGGW